MSVFYKLGTAAMRALPAETAHNTTIKALAAGLGPRTASGVHPDLQTTVGGLTLPNPVGLAAGFDKNAQVPDAMLRAGFGFTECGTMGFNNGGLEVFAKRMEARKGKPGIVGANLGANKDSDDRIADYLTGLTRLWGTSYWAVLRKPALSSHKAAARRLFSLRSRPTLKALRLNVLWSRPLPIKWTRSSLAIRQLPVRIA